MNFSIKIFNINIFNFSDFLLSLVNRTIYLINLNNIKFWLILFFKLDLMLNRNLVWLDTIFLNGCTKISTFLSEHPVHFRKSNFRALLKV